MQKSYKHKKHKKGKIGKIKVYFVRHGQSEGNKTFTHQKPDTLLSVEGREQAKKLAARLKSTHLDVIYTSNQKRAIETAETISRSLKKPIEEWEDLREVGTPSKVWGKRHDDPEVIKIWRQIHANWLKNEWRYSDEETPKELIERAGKVVDHLYKYHQGQHVLCISHGTAIKAVVARMIYGDSLTPEIFLSFRQHLFTSNTGITVCEYSDRFGWSLMSWNDTTHL